MPQTSRNANDVEHGRPAMRLAADIREFFKRLKAMGVAPKLVVTDGSPLYPKVIVEIWPEAKHQRCIFHYLKQVNQDLGKVF